jgi:hypothetical protein
VRKRRDGETKVPEVERAEEQIEIREVKDELRALRERAVELRRHL